MFRGKALSALGAAVAKIGARERAVKQGAAIARVAIGLSGALALAGCVIGGGAIDQATSTGAVSMAGPSPSIAAGPFATERPDDAGTADRLIDEDTIRLAVTTADPARLAAGPLPWANAATGSSGTVTDIGQARIAGQACRRFAATRNAYDGVSMYRGEVCLDPRSGWRTRSLSPLGGGDGA